LFVSAQSASIKVTATLPVISALGRKEKVSRLQTLEKKILTTSKIIPAPARIHPQRLLPELRACGFGRDACLGQKSRHVGHNTQAEIVAATQKDFARVRKEGDQLVFGRDDW
jgi:hypothetical protein